MTEEQFLTEFVALRDQLPRGHCLWRYKAGRWYPRGDTGGRLYSVDVTNDGAVTGYRWESTPENWPHSRQRVDVSPEEAWPVVLDLLRREVDRTRDAIARGAATRKRRHETKLKEVTDAWLRGEGVIYANRDDCVCCKKLLTDPESRARGIGPECWERIVRLIEAAQAEAA